MIKYEREKSETLNSMQAKMGTFQAKERQSMESFQERQRHICELRERLMGN
jgi:hypothetical protein